MRPTAAAEGRGEPSAGALLAGEVQAQDDVQSLSFEQVVQVYAAAWFDRNLLEWTDFGNLAKTGREGRVWTRVAVDSRRIWADLGVSRTQEQIDQEAEAGRAPVWPRQ